MASAAAIFMIANHNGSDKAVIVLHIQEPSASPVATIAATMEPTESPIILPTALPTAKPTKKPDEEFSLDAPEWE